MTAGRDQGLAIALFGELFMADQLARQRLSPTLPRGMTLSQFAVLNHLVSAGGELTPADLAQRFHVTRGAMTNTLARLERAGYAHVWPDWSDARKKRVRVSVAGRAARDAAVAAMTPIVSEVIREVGAGRVRAALPVLRALRERLDAPAGTGPAPD